VALKRLTLKDLEDDEQILPGTMGCQGCGGELALRQATKAFGKNTIMVNATGCLCVNVLMGATKFSFFHVAFENAAAVASGIDTALESLKKRDEYNLVCFAGDGGTADIGFQALSGAIERGHRFLYICYDNESYMNTGGQKSGTTPWGAKTSVTPSGKYWKNLQRPPYLRKDMPKIIAAHGAPYVATASIAYPLDYIKKIKKALSINGPTYIHVNAPCPIGWLFPENLTVKIARLAVQTRIFPLYETELGKIKITVPIPHEKPIKEYLKLQHRFAHISEKDMDDIQSWVDKRYVELGL
jgi:pyruvate ferredoxin oxidoreductase beta subunit